MNGSDAGLPARSYALRLVAGAVLLIVCALVVRPGPANAADDPPTASNPAATLPLDIPSQPLEDALYAFGAKTGIEVFVDGSAVKGRQSTEVKGTFTIAQALRVLLTGTGLEPQLIGARAITLSLGRQERPKTALYRSYSTTLQNVALRQLCSERDIGLGTYHIAMQLWINESGSVRRVELLSSTGDQARDRRIRNLLEGVAVGKPPRMLPQPVVMVILPRSIRDSGDCAVGAVPAASPAIAGDRDGKR